jgi:hypothetical protein
LLVGFLGVAGVQIGTLEHGWREAMTPQFIGGFLAQLAIVLRAMFTEKPGA